MGRWGEDISWRERQRQSQKVWSSCGAHTLSVCISQGYRRKVQSRIDGNEKMEMGRKEGPASGCDRVGVYIKVTSSKTSTGRDLSSGLSQDSCFGPVGTVATTQCNVPNIGRWAERHRRSHRYIPSIPQVGGECRHAWGMDYGDGDNGDEDGGANKEVRGQWARCETEEESVRRLSEPSFRIGGMKIASSHGMV